MFNTHRRAELNSFSTLTHHATQQKQRVRKKHGKEKHTNFDTFQALERTQSTTPHEVLEELYTNATMIDNLL